MKKIKIQLSRVLIVLAAVFSWVNAEALESFQQAGVISNVNSATVNIYHQGTNYRIRPDTEIRVPNVAKPRMSDFKKGHQVYLRGKILNGVYYVDLIVYLPEIPS